MRFEFAGFVVDAQEYRLLHEGREVPLERRTFDLLHFLITHRERLVTKEELLEQVWGARVLSDGALSNAIAKLRRALGQRAHDKRPIETIHGRGYRFHLPEVAAAAAQPSHERELPSDPFVGRAALMRTLLARLDRVAGGSEKLVVLTGEAGIGKTRLTRELAARATARGFAVWSGAAHEAGSAPGYWPWTQILRSAHEQLSDASWRGCLPARSWALSQLVPELVNASAPPRAVEPQMARFRLFDEVSSLLRCASLLQPVLVLLDDLHCADQGTLELLAFVARSLQDFPLLFVSTFRSGEFSRGRDASSAPLELARVATVLELNRLSSEEVRELAYAMTGAVDIDAQAVAALHERTQGNPLFVRQALDLARQRQDFSFAELAVEGADFPPAIRQLLRRRIAALPEGTQRLLASASVVGKGFTASLLAEVLGLEIEAVLDELEPALRSAVVEAKRPSAESFGFAHVLLQECLYEQLTLRERGELHGRIARALERRQGLDRAQTLFEIAHHRLNALPFSSPLALVACRRAAAAAQEASGFEAAAMLLTRAIEKLELEAGDAETRCQLLLELGEHQFYAGAIEGAWRAFSQAAESARASGRADLLAQAAPRLVDCLELGVGDPSYTRAAVEHALARLDAGALTLRASLLAQRAELALELSSGERVELLDQAAQLALQSGDSGAILEVAHSRAILRDPTRLSASASAATRFLELLEFHPEAAASMRYRSLRSFGAHLTLYVCALTSGDMVTAQAQLEQCAQIAEHSHVAAARFAVALLRAGRALGAHRLADLRAILQELAPAVMAQIPSAKLAWGGYFAALLEAEGRFDRSAAAQLERALDAAVATKDATYVLLARARSAALVGDGERARVLLAQLPAVELARMPVRYGDLGALCSLAEIYIALPDRDRAAALYQQLLPHAALNALGATFEYRGSVAHFLGLLAAWLGDAEAAQGHLEQAVVANRKLGMPRAVELSERALG
jgi:DNA-binding winged helix-turn-helix (wHTH) protein